MMEAKEIKRLTGAKTKTLGINILYAGFEKRSWHRNGREYHVAGYDCRKDFLHFTACWSLEGGGAGWSRVLLPLKDVILNADGDLSNAISV